VTVKDGDKEVAIPDLLIQRIGQTAASRYADRDRILFFVKQLNSKSPEERAYAQVWLRQAGAPAVAPMVQVLRDRGLKADHPTIVSTLLRGDPAVVPPLLAALDAPEEDVKATILTILTQRADRRLLPYLWYFSGKQGLSPSFLDLVARAKRALLVGELPPGGPRELLTKEAESYYLHRGALAADSNPTVYRWDDREGILEAKGTRTQAEEYYGIYWARKALELDPAYLPAQVVLISLALEKSVERNGPDKPLFASAAPDLRQLLAGTSAGLLEAVLDRALAEGRTGTALAAAQALGATADARLVRGTGSKAPTLIRALSYPDRRVQFAAAESLLQVPTREGYPGSTRVVEVLRRALVNEAGGKALIASSDKDTVARLSEQVRALGLTPVPVATGRAALARAAASGDVELLVIDAGIADPQLPDLVSLAQAGAETAAVPVVIVATADQAKTAQPLAARYRRVVALTPPPAAPELFKGLVEPLLQTPFRTPLTDAERTAQAKTAAEWLARIAQGEKPGYDVRPIEPALIQALGNDDLAPAMAQALARQPGRQAQEALAGLVLNATRPAPVRTEAARYLRQSLHRFGTLLPQDQLAGLAQLALAAEDVNLKEEVTRLVAGFYKKADQDGLRLQKFNPVPAAKPAEKPAEPEKEKEKDKEK
jgi:hypothetical protein